MHWYEICGVMSAAICIGTYATLQWRRDFAKTFLFSGLSFLNAALMLVSLAYSWNLGSFITNICYLFISLFGLYRCWQYQQRDGAAYVPKARRFNIRRQPAPPLQKAA